MKSNHPGARTASVYIEILVAVSLFTVMLLPLISSFQGGVRQTRLVKSHVAARLLAEWSLSEARAAIQAGTFEDEDCASPLFGDQVLTVDATTELPEVAEQLQELELRREISCLAVTGGDARTRVYSVVVRVAWRDPTNPQVKQLELRAVEGEEI